MDTHNYTGVERTTRAFLEGLQQNPGAPIYTLSPEKARAVISNLQAGPVSKLPVDIENYTIPSRPNSKDILIQVFRPHGEEQQ